MCRDDNDDWNIIMEENVSFAAVIHLLSFPTQNDCHVSVASYLQLWLGSCAGVNRKFQFYTKCEYPGQEDSSEL